MGWLVTLVPGPSVCQVLPACVFLTCLFDCSTLRLGFLPCRCLFMYAKLNPGLRYIQGMNELLAPLYFLFRTDPDRTSARYGEADAFYCFVDLISEFR